MKNKNTMFLDHRGERFSRLALSALLLYLRNLKPNSTHNKLLSNTVGGGHLSPEMREYWWRTAHGIEQCAATKCKPAKQQETKK